MYSKHATITITSDWLELQEDFDILSWGISASGSVIVQEYLLTGWGPDITILVGVPYFKNTSVQKIRIRTVSGNVTVSYSLLGFIAYRLLGETYPDASDLTTAVAQTHSHINFTILEAIQEAFTTLLKSAYDSAVALMHAQNTDTKLAEGEDSEVTAYECRDAANKRHDAHSDDQDLSGLVPKTTKVNGHELSADVTVSAGDVGLGTLDSPTFSGLSVTGAISEAVVSTAVNLVLTGAHRLIFCTTNLMITLPSAVGIIGRAYNIINVGSGAVMLQPILSQTINGEGSLTLESQYDSVVIVSDGTNWVRNS